MPDDMPVHHCPGCGTAQKPFARYPWYFCNECRGKTVDANGRAVGFYERTLNGGLAWFHLNDKNRMQANVLQVCCLILGRPVVVKAARFGGIVAQPDFASSTHEIDPGRYPDLTKPHSLQAAAAFMQDGD